MTIIYALYNRPPTNIILFDLDNFILFYISINLFTFLHRRTHKKKHTRQQQKCTTTQHKYMTFIPIQKCSTYFVGYYGYYNNLFIQYYFVSILNIHALS